MRTRLPGYLAAPMRLGSVMGALVVAGRADGDYSPEDQQLLFALARQGAAALENATAQEQAVNFFTHTSDILVSCLETMDVFYPGHSRGVAALADMVTRRLGLSDAERRSVHYASLLHDIGKVMIDPEVLRTKGPITPEARKIIQDHPALGMQLLKPITLWEDILPIIHSHHERWDGGGYPTGPEGGGDPGRRARRRDRGRVRRHDPRDAPRQAPLGGRGPGRAGGVRRQPVRSAHRPLVRGGVPRTAPPDPDVLT